MTDPVLLIPGFAQDARAFLPLICTLSIDRAVQIAIPSGSDVADMADQTIAAAPSKFHLIGQGLGGSVALDICLRQPERVRSLTLLGTSPLPKSPSRAAELETLIVKAQAGDMAGALKALTGFADISDAEEQTRIKDLFGETAFDLGTTLIVQQMRALQKRPGTQKMLHQIAQPSLVVAGAQDQIVPLQRQEGMAGLIPKAQIKVIKGAGHLVHMEAPIRVSELISDFLTMQG